MWLPDDICPGTKRNAPIGISASSGRPKPKSVSATKAMRVHKTSNPNWSAMPIGWRIAATVQAAPVLMCCSTMS